MSTTSKPVWETENEWFPKTLRGFMASHPATGETTTQKALADVLDVRPQTLSLYCNGQTQPTPAKLLKIAEYFGVTTDFLLTGKRVENRPVRELLGLSESTVQAMKFVKEGYFEDCPAMLPVLDCLLGEKDFYLALETAVNCHAQKQGHNDDYQQFLEWRAAGFLEKFLLDFFRHDLVRIYNRMREGD